MIVGTRFMDKYEKRNGAWKFAYRTHCVDWLIENDPSEVRRDYPWLAGSILGKLGPADPSYEFFRPLKLSKRQ